MRIVTLLTDFGLADTYVGQMKGAILAIAPDTPLVDLTHAVPPQDVAAGAFLLWTSVEVFPPGTIHLAVVDPGVGSSRRALGIRTGRGDLLVGPDNGLLLRASQRLGGVELAVALDPRGAVARPTSATFHGRDLFGPVAALLASGRALEALGTPVSDLVAGPLPPVPLREGDRLVGAVIHVDSYGNLVTNLPAASAPLPFGLRAAGREVHSAHCYADVAEGELVALHGSSGLVELSVRNGSAAKTLELSRGARVELWRG